MLHPANIWCTLYVSGLPGYSFRVTVSMYKSNTISENRSRRRRRRHPVVLLSSKTGRQVAPNCQVAPDCQMAPPTRFGKEVGWVKVGG